MGKPEQYVEYYLRDEGKRRGYLALKWECPGHAGVPDRIVIGHGQIVLVECKREKGGRLSAVQKMMIPRLQAGGADVRVISSREAVDALFDELDQREREVKTNGKNQDVSGQQTPAGRKRTG